MSRLLGGFLTFLMPAPAKVGRGEEAFLGEKEGVSSCKGHLRTLCEGILLKGDFVDGWADAHDGGVGHAAW